MVVIEVEIEGVDVLESRQGIDIQLKRHVLEHKIQPHLLQLMIRLVIIGKGPFLLFTFTFGHSFQLYKFQY